MKLVQMDPPGTWCLNYAFAEVIKKHEMKTFIEVGPGEGETVRGSKRVRKSGSEIRGKIPENEPVTGRGKRTGEQLSGTSGGSESRESTPQGKTKQDYGMCERAAREADRNHVIADDDAPAAIGPQHAAGRPAQLEHEFRRDRVCPDPAADPVGSEIFSGHARCLRCAQQRL